MSNIIYDSYVILDGIYRPYSQIMLKCSVVDLGVMHGGQASFPLFPLSSSFPLPSFLLSPLQIPFLPLEVGSLEVGHPWLRLEGLWER